jgi:ABC-type uncharacterized transport system permease subunit
MLKHKGKQMKLSPPSPEVRAVLKMMGIAAVICSAQALVYVLARYFTGEKIIQGMALTLLAGAIYMIYQMFLDQERRKDTASNLEQQ